MRPWYRHPLFILLILIIVFFLPAYLARVAYEHHVGFGKTTNHGELLKPPLELAKLKLTNKLDQPVTTQTLEGHWLMLLVVGEQCDSDCQRGLYNMRQIRMATGKDMNRIARAVVSPKSINQAFGQLLVREYEGTWHFYANPSTLSLQTGSLYLVDPRGFVALRYPPNANPTNILKDLERLLKYSKGGSAS